MAKNDSTCPQALLGESVYLVLLCFSFSLPPLALQCFPKVCYSCRPGGTWLFAFGSCAADREMLRPSVPTHAAQVLRREIRRAPGPAPLPADGRSIAESLSSAAGLAEADFCTERRRGRRRTKRSHLSVY